MQLLSGMAGAIIIEGDIDQVPEIAEATEQLTVIQELRVDEDGRTWERFADSGDVNVLEQATTLWTVNGAELPTLRMRPGEVGRWRLVFAGMANGAEVALDGHLFHQIALDGITFPALETQEGLTIAPGNRADVLVQAGAPGIYELVLRPIQPGEAAMQLPPAVLLSLVVEGEPVAGRLPPHRFPRPPCCLPFLTAS